MREIFAEQPERDPGAVFYTITDADVGKTVIQTEIGPIHVADVIGRVLKHDVGKRLYRVQCDDPAAGWIWQFENDAQRGTYRGEPLEVAQ